MPNFKFSECWMGKEYFMLNWKNKIESLHRILTLLNFSINADHISVDDGFNNLKNITEKVCLERKTVYVIGNGASASMASHFAADLAKNGKLHTQVFSDLALITAISNDLGYDQVFSEPLRRVGKSGDLLVAISSSGNSQNILSAVNEAKHIGMNTVTLSAMSQDNQLRKLGDINLYIPAKTYGDAESCHAAILHHWIDLILSTK